MNSRTKNWSTLPGTKTTSTSGCIVGVAFATDSVKITGRPMHNTASLVPREAYGYPGFEYVVPLVTK